MADHFTNRIDWLTPSLALTVWAAHFGLLWSAASVFPGAPAARWIAAALTLAAGAALYLLWRRTSGAKLLTVPRLGIAIAAAGVSFSMLPAVIG